MFNNLFSTKQGAQIIMTVTALEIGIGWRVLYFISGWGLVFLRCGGLVTSLLSDVAVVPTKKGK